MGIDETIRGIWSIPSGQFPGNDEFLYLGECGRAVSFTYLQPRRDRMHTMKNWVQSIGDNQFSIRLKPGGEEWVVEMSVMGNVLKMKMRKGTLNFQRVRESDVPDWFEAKLEEALAEMTELEKNNE